MGLFPYPFSMNSIIPRVSTQQDFTDPKIQSQAKAMYYSGVILTEIAMALQIPMSDLRKAAFGKKLDGKAKNCWFAMKERRDKELGVKNASTVSTYQKTKYYFLKDTEAKLLDLVRKSLENFEKDKTLLYTMPEIKQALEALTKLDGINRLENNKPTQIVQIEHGLSLREVTDQYKNAIPAISQEIEKDGSPSE